MDFRSGHFRSITEWHLLKIQSATGFQDSQTNRKQARSISHPRKYKFINSQTKKQP